MNLIEARKKSELATRNGAADPEAWHALAETCLRQARATSQQPVLKKQHIELGISAVEKVLTLYPLHRQGLVTRAALLQL